MEVDVCFCPVTDEVTRKHNPYVLCLIYHDKRNLQHQIISHLIASQIIKNDTLIFFIDIIHYTLFDYKLLVIT